jgi:hypothetical protein
MTENSVTVNSSRNNVIVSTPGPQGPRGKGILNGSGVPSNNLGLAGDFYYDVITTKFYGPKLSDATWVGAQNYILNNPPTDYSFRYSWELSQITGPVANTYSVVVLHNLGFYPNVTVKTSAGDILETGIDYNNINQITLTMAQPFSGTAHLS